MDRTEKFEKAKKYARQLGFDNVWYNDETFSAEDRKTRISVYAGTQYGGRYFVEIGWASAGTPGPNNREVKRFIKILQNALKLKEKLK